MSIFLTTPLKSRTSLRGNEAIWIMDEFSKAPFDKLSAPLRISGKSICGFFTISLLFGQSFVAAQEFSEKTNTVSVDLTRPVEPNTLPNISWKSPALSLTGTTTSAVVIEAVITSLHAISEVKIKVKNGTNEKEELVSVDKIEYTKKFAQQVSLFEGLNEVYITATNAKGGKISSVKSIRFDQGALQELMHVNRRDYALIFATDKYDNWKDLYNPIAGAQALAQVIVNDYGFEAEVVRNPNANEVTKKIAEYKAKAYSSQDQLFVYFAGNCFFDKLMGYGYIVGVNSTKNDQIDDTYLSLKQLRTTLNDFSCNHIFLTVDACCSDLADTRFPTAPSLAMTQKDIIGSLAIKSRKFINTGALEYTADNIPGHFSPFTSLLIESLKQTSGTKTSKTFNDVNANFKTIEFHSGGFGADNPKGEFFFFPK